MVYGKLYGAGIPTLAAQVGCGIEVAEAVVNTLDAITPTLARSAATALLRPPRDQSSASAGWWLPPPG